jgi:ABC-type transporter Mla subunit MlaD
MRYMGYGAFGILLLLILSIGQMIPGALIRIEAEVQAGLYKCPGGFVDATILLRDSLSKLYKIANASNISLPQSIIARVSEASNLSYDKVASMSAEDCKALYSDLLVTLKNLTSYMGIYLEPQAKGAYERATLRAAEKLLERARSLNASDIAMDISDKISKGNISPKDLDDLDRKLEAKAIALKIHDIRAIVLKISEEKIFKPNISQRDLEAVSKAEEVLKRARELLTAVNASREAVVAIDQAIDNVSKAKSILEKARSMPEAERVRAIADRLENQIKDLISRLRNISTDNASVQEILGLLTNASKIVSEARAMIQAGNLSEALRMLEEAYKLYKIAEDRAEDILKKIPRAEEDITQRYKEVLERLSELSRKFEDVKLKASNISDPAVRELISKIQTSLREASNISSNISQLINAGKAEEVKAMVNMLIARISNIEALIKALEELLEKLYESKGDIAKKLGEIINETNELWNRFQVLKANASNISNQSVRALIDMIQRSFEELNHTIANTSKAIETGNIRETSANIEKCRALLDSIKKMLDRLEGLLKELSRGRR